MLEQAFLTLNEWMLASLGLALAGSFLWGMVSVLFSPCHLASIPLMIGYIAGQKENPGGRQALGYSLVFSLGLFTSIALIGLACTLLGRMLGDVSPYWAVAAGMLFIYLGFDLMGVTLCSLPRSKGLPSLRGYSGAGILGLSYGVLSGACTFGFIAPILGMVSLQQQMVHGLLLLVAFGLGHCLPIALAGSSVTLAQAFLLHRGLQQAVFWGRKAAGMLVILVGIYFVASPFIAGIK